MAETHDLAGTFLGDHPLHIVYLLVESISEVSQNRLQFIPVCGFRSVAQSAYSLFSGWTRTHKADFIQARHTLTVR